VRFGSGGWCKLSVVVIGGPIIAVVPGSM